MLVVRYLVFVVCCLLVVVRCLSCVAYSCVWLSVVVCCSDMFVFGVYVGCVLFVVCCCVLCVVH